MQNKFLLYIFATILFTVDAGDLKDQRHLGDNSKCMNCICKSTSSSSLNFFLIGDSGGIPVFPYKTYAQIKVAEAMVKLSKSHRVKPKFIMSAGDNIYYNGVANENDERFRTSFEDIYNDEALDIPWYMIAGNHDHFGNITGQIAYTDRSTKWKFPSLYYKISYAFGNDPTLVDFIMIDTVMLCGNTRDIDNANFLEMIISQKIENPNKPKDPKAAEEHLDWIELQINTSKSDYLFVVGHYPIYSVADHGPTQCLIDKLNPILKKYHVSAYFSGHDHNLQHLVVSYEDPMQPNEKFVMNYIVSGASSRSDNSKKHMKDIPPDSLRFRYPSSFNPLSQLGFTNGGFIAVNITKEGGNFLFYNGLIHQKYSCYIKPRKMV